VIIYIENFNKTDVIILISNTNSCRIEQREIHKETGGELIFSGMVSSSCYTSGTCSVTLVCYKPGDKSRMKKGLDLDHIIVDRCFFSFALFLLVIVFSVRLFTDSDYLPLVSSEFLTLFKCVLKCKYEDSLVSIYSYWLSHLYITVIPR
jgi:hypothetical protein